MLDAWEILLCSVAITGCIGDDSEEMIEQLEVEANESKAIMESLNQTIDALGADIIDSAAEIDGVPQDNGVDDEVET